MIKAPNRRNKEIYATVITEAAFLLLSSGSNVERMSDAS